MWLVTFIGVIFFGPFQVHIPPSGALTSLHQHSADSSSQGATAIKQRCPLLKSGQTITITISLQHLACLSVEVEQGQAQQLAVAQPALNQPEDEDLEIHVRAEDFERLVDEFDMGNETVTLRTPGVYRIEVGRVVAGHEIVTTTVSTQPLPLAQAPAWEDAEKWATMSKRSKKTESIDKSLALWSQLGDTASIARTYLKRESALRNNDPTNARIAAEQALDLCHATSDVRCSAEAANNSAVSSRKLGDVESATERYVEAADDWQKLGNSINAAVTRSNFGLFLLLSGSFEDALRELESAKVVLRGKSSGAYANVLNNLGLYYQSLAEYDKANEYFQNALSRFVHDRNPKELLTRLNLGRNYMLEGQNARAQSLLKHVLEDAMKRPDPMTTADALRNLGQTLWRQGDTEKARARLEEAFEIDRSNKYLRGQSSALHFLGLIAQKNGDIAGARDLLLQAVNMRRSGGQRDDAAESLGAVADLEFKAGNLSAARGFADQALKELELVRSQVPGPALRASFYSRKRHFFDLLVEIALAPGTTAAQAEGLLAAERGRARSLMDLLSGDLVLQQLPSDLLQRRDSIQKQLDFLSKTETDKSGEVRRRRINRLLDEADEVETKIREFIVSEKLCPALESVDQLQQSLPANSAILEYHLGRQHSYLWLVDAQTIRLFYLPPAAEIEAVANRVVQYFGHFPDRQDSPDKQAAFNRAVKRLSAILLGRLSGVQLPQRLILVADGILHQVPFAALKSPDAHAPLGLSHDLVQIPSAAYLTVGRHTRSIAEFPRAILAMVDPVFSLADPRVPSTHQKPSGGHPEEDLPRLPFTGEIKVVEFLVDKSRRKVLRGFDASRQMLESLHLEDFGVLYLSTHALIDDRLPEMSRIVLSMFDHKGRHVDGVLRPNELAKLHLNSSIVVLSACNTALGKQVLGEGVAGLTSSLLAAGGSQLVLTLTEVDAESASDFFRKVYRNFLTGSTSMEHALTLARRAMAHKYSDPYYWASFIVVGRPADNVVVIAPPLGASHRTK